MGLAKRFDKWKKTRDQQLSTRQQGQQGTSTGYLTDSRKDGNMILGNPDLMTCNENGSPPMTKQEVDDTAGVARIVMDFSDVAHSGAVNHQI